mmetsp:Transcript_4866/g.13581  ORF Transcript_4866/g.13581 Transcript_4866/m.13581 type:complete len:256 (+) Transcript_4866:220-987(+)
MALDADSPISSDCPPFLTDFIMPYSMRPRSNARCMRSRVTISLSVRYQILGPLKTTIHGSQTPTQIECRQLSMVCGVQSSAWIDSSTLVPFMMRPYSSLETKNGWAHSSYRNCRLALSSSVKGFSGVSSRWHHVATARLPPGARTRVISSTYAFLSGMCSPDSQAQTRSKVLSSNSISNAFITLKAMLISPRSLASSVPRATCFGERVMPMTSASGKAAANRREVPPMPQPTSRIFLGLVVPDHFSISSMKSYFA